MGPCCFVSDLHLFARRSDAGRYQHAIAARASKASIFVLGGDIFDFRWARMPGATDAVEEAIRWLREIALRCPRCHFHLVLGNHDYHQPFIERLVDLEAVLPNFSWHPFYVRLGSSIFLHGDVANRKMTARKLARSRNRWLRKKLVRASIRHTLYDVLVLSRIHKVLPRVVHPRRAVARRILAYLDDIGHGPTNGVRSVYFGHTHSAMHDYHYRGVAFHNGGAPIKGMKFRILEAEL